MRTAWAWLRCWRRSAPRAPRGGAGRAVAFRGAAVREHRLLRAGQGGVRGAGARPSPRCCAARSTAIRARTSSASAQPQRGDAHARPRARLSGWTRPARRRSASGPGARYTVTGSFADFYGKFRINARLVDTPRRGEIVKVVSNDDPKLQDRAQLAAIIQLVAERLTSAAGLPPYPAGTAPPAIPTDAITAFSRGAAPREARATAPRRASATRARSRRSLSSTKPAQA